MHSPSYRPAVEGSYIDFLHACVSSSPADGSSESNDAAPKSKDQESRSQEGRGQKSRDQVSVSKAGIRKAHLLAFRLNFLRQRSHLPWRILVCLLLHCCCPSCYCDDLSLQADCHCCRWCPPCCALLVGTWHPGWMLPGVCALDMLCIT